MLAYGFGGYSPSWWGGYGGRDSQSQWWESHLAGSGRAERTKQEAEPSNKRHPHPPPRVNSVLQLGFPTPMSHSLWDQHHYLGTMNSDAGDWGRTFEIQIMTVAQAGLEGTILLPGAPGITGRHLTSGVVLLFCLQKNLCT